MLPPASRPSPSGSCLSNLPDGVSLHHVLPWRMTLRRHHSVNPETEQSDRMARWFVRLCALEKQGVDERAFIEFALVVLQQCDAMRDWLKEATTIKTARDSSNPGRSYKTLELPPIPLPEITLT